MGIVWMTKRMRNLSWPIGIWSSSAHYNSTITSTSFNHPSRHFCRWPLNYCQSNLHCCTQGTVSWSFWIIKFVWTKWWKYGVYHRQWRMNWWQVNSCPVNQCLQGLLCWWFITRKDISRRNWFLWKVIYWYRATIQYNSNSRCWGERIYKSMQGTL